MGKHCETPCPEGSYGTMCGARCDCKTRHCHPQTGACLPDDEIVMFDNITRTVESSYSSESTERISAEQWIKVENDTTPIASSTSSVATEVPTTSSSSSSSTPTSTVTSTTTTTSTTTEVDGSSPEPSSATYAESYHEYLPNNTEMSMVLTKGHSRYASNDSMYELVTTTSRVEITFIDTAVQKVEDRDATHGNASMEEQDRDDGTDDTANVTDTQLVYLESSNQPVLVGIQTTDQEADRNRRQDESRDRQAFVTISCLLITLALLCSVVAYLKRLDRKTLVKPSGTVVPPPVKIVDGSVQTGIDPNRSSEPLPDLPHVTYTRVKPKQERNGDLEHYDVPANNSFIHRAKSSPYNYNFSANSKPPPRKYSLEHIYDEIQYPPLAEITAGSTTAQADKARQPAMDATSDAGYCKPMGHSEGGRT
ncbi:hypothetical protein AND_006027 [Anopheles darlingi]|uniref:Uncharacterized protein n=1 Tax=Anopheles darlingi TaxID=43151 RepID=W5JH85_ANODA|nr:hypothetical protein AND_006027 [Anopheles darlingi]